MKKLLRAVALLCAFLLLCGCAAAEGFPAEMEERMAAIFRQYGTVGAAVAYVQNGRVVATYAYGYATKYSAPMTADSKVRLASLSKVMVTLAVVFAQEDGLLTLDQPLDELIGCRIKTHAPGDVITPRTILTHTSSISLNEGQKCHFDTVRGLLESGKGVRTIVSGDVRRWCYNNYAFGVLGLSVEHATGQTIDAILDSHLFDKLEIDGAFWPGELDDPSALATIYDSNGNATRVYYDDHLTTNPGLATNGAVFSGNYLASAYDVAKVLAVLASGGYYAGERVLSADILDTMESRIEIPGEKFLQAHPMRYRADLYGREGIYYHTGSFEGELNMMSYDPVVGDGVVVLSTGAHGRDHNGLYAVCSLVSDLIYGWDW